MAYTLGVDLGTTFTAAAVLRDGAAPEVFTLGDRSAAVPSVLFIGADDTVLYGDAAERRALTEPDRVVRQFKRRIGDETPLVVGCARHQRYFAHDLAAMMIAWVVAKVTEREGAAPASIAVTHPASWGPHKKELLLGALAAQDLAAALVSEPEAAAISYAHTGRLAADATVAVYDLGGGTFDVALLQADLDGRFALVGRPHGLPELGGIDFDDAILTHVLGSLGDALDPELFDGDLDPVTAAAMSRLRADSVDAKEALSSDTAATVPVLLADIATNIRITRAEFEDLVGGSLELTLDAFDRALDDADLDAEQLTCLLLTGGSSRIPLVTQMLSAHLGPGVAVTRDIDPKLAVATGAALSLSLTPADAPLAPVVDLFDVATDTAPADRDEDGRGADVFADDLTTEIPVVTAKTRRPAKVRADKKPRPEKARPQKARPANAPAHEPVADEVEVAAFVAATPVEVAQPEVARPKVTQPKVALQKVALGKVPGTKAARAAASAVAAATSGLEPVPAPIISGVPGTGRPIMHRRGAGRSALVGLELDESARPAAREADLAGGIEIPAEQAPRFVVPARPVAGLEDLMRAAPGAAFPAAQAEQPAAMELTPLEVLEPDAPARPALGEMAFLDDEMLAEEIGATRDRGRFVLVTVRRVLAVTTLTAAIFAGSGAWVAAIPATTEPTAAASTHSDSGSGPRNR